MPYRSSARRGLRAVFRGDNERACASIGTRAEVGVTPQEAADFVKHHGVVLQAARGPVPSLAEAIAGGPIRGSWWGHPKGHDIYRATEAISDNPDVLVCKVLDGRITYVHRRLWP